MADIKNYLVVRHARAERSAHLLQHVDGELKRSGRGLAFWFVPLSTSLAEIPVDDRELDFLFHARTSDYQDVSVQGVVIYRVAAPETIAERIDFTIDLARGHYRHEPLERIGLMLTELAQELAHGAIAAASVREVLRAGPAPIRERIEGGLRGDDNLTAIGLEILAVRVSAVKPAADLERALEMPTREAVQQEADEATFQRRALAVEKERAIQENELENQIELTRRHERLIEQEGLNARRKAKDAADARRIEVEARAEERRIDTDAEAARIRAIDEARVRGERERIDIYRDLPPTVLAGLAARELAGKLQKIDHLSLSPDLLGPSLLRWLDAGRLEREGGQP